MPFNLTDFKGALTGQGARPTLFDVQITSPSYTAGDPVGKINFTCRAAQLPGKTFGVIEVPYFGRKVKVAGDQTFAEWTVTVINDEDFVTRNAFEKWMSGINQHAANVRTNLTYKQGNATVTQYTKDGNIADFGNATYNFIGIFPADLGAIDVAWDTNDSLEEYTVTLQYDWWEKLDTTDAG